MMAARSMSAASGAFIRGTPREKIDAAYYTATGGVGGDGNDGGTERFYGDAVGRPGMPVADLGRLGVVVRHGRGLNQLTPRMRILVAIEGQDFRQYAGCLL